jgi:hypothetical protein
MYLILDVVYVLDFYRLQEPLHDDELHDTFHKFFLRTKEPSYLKKTEHKISHKSEYLELSSNIY